MSIGSTAQQQVNQPRALNHFFEPAQGPAVALSKQAWQQAMAPPPLEEDHLRRGFDDIGHELLRSLRPKYPVIKKCDLDGDPRFLMRVGVDRSKVDAAGKPVEGYYVVESIARREGIASLQPTPPAAGPPGPGIPGIRQDEPARPNDPHLTDPGGN